jgi:transcription termination/antitermination protein NusG
MAKQQSQGRHWYAIQTYSGYEERVAENLKERVKNLGLEDIIFDVIVPKEKTIEIRNSKRKTVEKKMFPGYILVDMSVTDESWYVVRNTPQVTGFIGAGITPVPVEESKMREVKKRMGVDEPKYQIDLKKGDLVAITDGPFKGFDGSIDEIDEAKNKVKVLVSMFGRETAVELDSLQVKKL